MMFNSMSRYLIQSFFKLYLRKYKYFSVLPSLSIEINLTMKKLINAKQYRQALDFVDPQLSMCNNMTLTLALKACSKLNDYQYGIQIHQKLSLKALQDPFIQTSLIHFYSKCSISVLNFLSDSTFLV